ncbi:MAG: NlpC/P60 family protein [Actinomycetia bacterium]|nr:NlpC/P60 family protein [Actinomycetes bacterium]
MLCALLLSCVICLPQAASATPASDKRAQAQVVQQEIQDLNVALDKASNDYYQAAAKLEKAQADQKANQDKLDKTKARLTVVQKHLNNRAAEMYRSGPTGFADVLFGATDFQQFAQLWDFLGELNQKDAASSIELKQLRDQTTALQGKLAENTKQAQASADQMEQIKAGVEANLAEQKSKLAGIEAEVAALQAQAAAAALADSQRQARSPGIEPGIADPGYPSQSGVVEIAKSFLGVPYVWGGSSPSGFDCSGLTSYCYRQVGISIPRVASAQQAAYPAVSRANLQPGDLVFFGYPAYHVGMYIGGGLMIHAPQPGDVVRISGAFGGDYSGACRPR